MATTSTGDSTAEPRIPWYKPTFARVLIGFILFQVALAFACLSGWIPLVEGRIDGLLLTIILPIVFFLLLGLGMVLSAVWKSRWTLVLSIVTLVTVPWFFIRREWSIAANRAEVFRLSRRLDFDTSRDTMVTDVLKEIRDSSELPVAFDFLMYELESLDATGLSESDFRRTGELSHLKRLVVRDAQFANRTWTSTLDRLKHVKELDLAGSNISDEVLLTLTEMQNIGWLNLDRTPVTGACLTMVRDSLSLRSLSLAGTKITDEDIGKLGDPEYLERIDVSDTAITDATIARIGALPRLGHLELRRTKVTGASFGSLPPETWFRRVDLTGAAVTDQGLQGIGRIKNITALLLNDCKITDDGVRHLGHVSYLSTLSLRNAAASGEGFDSFENVNRLEELDLGNSPITDQGVAAIAKLVSLRKLNLENSQITDAAAKLLVGLPNLSTLKLGGTKFGDDGLATLLETKPWLQIDHANTKVTDEGVRRIHEARWRKLGAPSGMPGFAPGMPGPMPAGTANPLPGSSPGQPVPPPSVPEIKPVPTTDNQIQPLAPSSTRPSWIELLRVDPGLVHAPTRTIDRKPRLAVVGT